jgi:aminomethyltransferase
MSDLRETPLFAKANAYNPKTEWDSWALCKTALSISGTPDEECQFIRSGTAMFDMCPVIKYSIKGSEATKFLNHIMTRQMDIEPGRVTYTTWCNAHGKTIDDGTVFRIGKDEYRIMPGARQLEFLQGAAKGFSVEVKDITNDMACLTVQGKTSYASLKQIGIAGLETMKPFRFADATFNGKKISVSRTSFVGDLGYEIWCDNSLIGDVWDALVKAGAKPMGIIALVQARLEAGLIVPDADFDFKPAKPDGSEADDFNRSPLELGLEFVVDFTKGDFVGKAALEAEKQKGSTWNLVGLEIEGTQSSSHGNEVKAGGNVVGEVTSAWFSSNLKKSIALATVKAAHGKVGTALTVAIDGKDVSAKVVERPFYKTDRKTQTPPQG